MRGKRNETETHSWIFRWKNHPLSERVVPLPAMLFSCSQSNFVMLAQDDDDDEEELDGGHHLGCPSWFWRPKWLLLICGLNLEQKQ